MHGVLQGVEDTGTDALVQKINLIWKGVVGLRYQRGCSLHAGNERMGFTNTEQKEIENVELGCWSGASSQCWFASKP